MRALSLSPLARLANFFSDRTLLIAEHLMKLVFTKSTADPGLYLMTEKVLRCINGYSLGERRDCSPCLECRCCCFSLLVRSCVQLVEKDQLSTLLKPRLALLSSDGSCVCVCVGFSSVARRLA